MKEVKCKISLELSGIVWQGECKTHKVKWIQYNGSKPKQCAIAEMKAPLPAVKSSG